MVHVGMNIPDKQAVFAEVHRVLAPGGRFAIYEQMRTADGDLPYPLPWAEDERSSFVETPEDYTRHLEAAGFTVEEVEDRTASTLGPPPTGPVTNARRSSARSSNGSATTSPPPRRTARGDPGRRPAPDRCGRASARRRARVST